MHWNSSCGALVLGFLMVAVSAVGQEAAPAAAPPSHVEQVAQALQAAQAEMAAFREQAEGDTEKLKRLEGEIASLQQDLAELRAGGDAPDETQIDLHAYVNLEFEKQTSEEGRGDPNGSLDMDVAELLLNARRGRLRTALAFDIEHGADTERALGTVNLGFGFLEYQFSDAFKLRAGKLLNTFGFYNEIHTVKAGYPTVKEANSTLKPYRLSRNAFRYAPKWETGLAALGSIPVGGGSLDYVVSLANGENVALGSGDAVLDTNPYDEDNNAAKSLTARVQYRPRAELTFAVSAYTDRLTQEVDDAAQDGQLRSFGAYAQYSGGPWFLLAEVNHGRLEPAAGGAAASQLGWVGTVGYRIRERWMPFGQVERVRTRRAGVEDWGMAYIVGLNVTVKEGLLIKIDNDYFKGSANNRRLGSFPNQAYNEIKAALVAGF